ncbi:MAG: hypothetical protein ABI891_01230 [Acidobacteriota bacterium]
MPEIRGGLFSVGQIILATFFGMPIAGCLLLARNYRQLGKNAVARQTLAAGVISTIVLLISSFFLPEKFPNMILPVAYCFAMRQLVIYLQGDIIDNYLKNGENKGSWAIAAAIGLGCLAVILGLIFGFIIAFNI